MFLQRIILAELQPNKTFGNLKLLTQSYLTLAVSTASRQVLTASIIDGMHNLCMHWALAVSSTAVNVQWPQSWCSNKS